MAFKKILNLHEEATHVRLKETCDKYGATVYPKVRLADILPIEGSGIDDGLYRFALQAHFDFTVAGENHEPLFAVEFDGALHRTSEQIKRDKKKNALCEKFKFPLLRINARYLNKKYRNLDLLSWFVEVWFFREAFFEAQKNGLVPWDEPFDPMLIMGLPGREELFPLWLSAELRVKLNQLSEQKKIKDFAPTEWIGADKDGNYYGLIWLWIDDDNCVLAQTAMRAQNFPVVESEVLSELLVFLLFEELSKVLEGQAEAIPIKEINKKVTSFTEKYQMHLAGGLHLPPGNPFKQPNIALNENTR